MHEIVPCKKPKGPCIKQLVVLISALVLSGQVYVHIAYATPAAPVGLVNHTLKRCFAHVILADECHFCKPAEGWEIIQTGQCPSGYTITNRQILMDMPLNCVEYPKNEWAFCSWGIYPTITPESPNVTVVPDLTVTAQQPVVDPPTPSAAPATPVIKRYPFEYPISPILCMGSILGVAITGIVLMMIRRKRL
jgi:hypothetical protein